MPTKVKAPVETETGYIPVAPTGPRKRRTYDKPDVPDFSPKKDRVCVLTGASGYLGTRFLKRCSLDYQIVAIRNSRPLEPPQKLVDPLYASFPIENPAPFEIVADLTKPEEVTRIVSTVLEEFGKVDLLINAACHRNWLKLLVHEDGLRHAEWSFAVNVIAPMRLATEFARRFWAKQPYEDNRAANRNVINISSTSGSFIYPDTGQAVYSATKAALDYASYHMASEMWDIGIRVNTIAPNSFPTYVSPEHVLDTIVAMDKSAKTGQHIIIDKTD